MEKVVLHVPVMLEEVLTYLNIIPEGIYVDATLGTGGHSKEILKRLKGKGLLIGFDKDIESINIAEKNLKEISSNFILVNKSFHEIPEVLKDLNIEKVNGILYDLGLSSFQLEGSKRGFSFKNLDEPLDMRFSLNESLRASDILNSYCEKALEKIFWEYGEEPFSRKIANLIISERKKKSFEKVRDLVSLIEKNIPRRGKIHPATRIFQALRIEVNNELKILENSLENILPFLKEGARIIVLSYHSLEDRIVKNFLRNNESLGKIKIISKKILKPSEEEVKRNPRARSAKMRVGEKIG
ncbi:MAG: 16S rRNA (cytosine(1402)-N(4))-methyltransferase RsmH [Dictyoglomus sp.]|nr:16S rRNA (cytosine(1402)-N(4))-methyltransferase RsmH [Dictyoglomus sp.]MCX7942366.1 16S rRNA (cytosine(1402)-N(4))-methyltransferase RsmH [Dictyoglomaceae bacterium]MDW8188430.1 16S rRNA (cytosine(1402)-N(4))-methyltransferase RsmH [Dictyoglomus sp.]